MLSTIGAMLGSEPSGIGVRERNVRLTIEYVMRNERSCRLLHNQVYRDLGYRQVGGRLLWIGFCEDSGSGPNSRLDGVKHVLVSTPIPLL